MTFVRAYRVAWLIVAVISLLACTEKQQSDGSVTVGCRPNGAVTGKESTQPHSSNPSQCKFGLVLMCNACVYDAAGRLSHLTSEVCGVCVTGSF